MSVLFDLIESAFVEARDQTAYTNDPISAMLIVEALVDAGYAVDDQRGEASLEARIERAFQTVKDEWEGAWWWHTEQVTYAVAKALGLWLPGAARQAA